MPVATARLRPGQYPRGPHSSPPTEWLRATTVRNKATAVSCAGSKALRPSAHGVRKTSSVGTELLCRRCGVSLRRREPAKLPGCLPPQRIHMGTAELQLQLQLQLQLPNGSLPAPFRRCLSPLSRLRRRGRGRGPPEARSGPAPTENPPPARGRVAALRPPGGGPLRVARRGGGHRGRRACRPQSRAPAPPAWDGRRSLARASAFALTHFALSVQTGTGRSMRKALRARFSRLFTVPTGMPMASAISS